MSDRTLGRFALAHRLGVAPSEIRRMVARGTIPPPDAGRGSGSCDRWRRETILSWEASGCPKTPVEEK